MRLLPIAFFIASVAALVYGYIRNNRNIMLAAALALFLSVGVHEFIRDVRGAKEEFQAGFREGWTAAQPKSGASGADRK
jgi:hypothetical protein